MIVELVIPGGPLIVVVVGHTSSLRLIAVCIRNLLCDARERNLCFMSSCPSDFN